MQNNDKLKLLIHHNKNNLYLHNLKTQKIKINLHIKNIAPIVREQIFPSQLVSKDTEKTKTKGKLTLDPNLLKNHLYNNSVLIAFIEQNAMIHDTEVEVHHEINLTTTTIHKTDIALQLEIDLDMTKVLLIHTTLDHDMTTTKETRDLIALLIDPHTDDLINVTPVTDTDHAHIQEITTDLHFFSDHLSDIEILGFLDLAHIPIQKKQLNTIQPKLAQITLNYKCITHLKWQTL